MAFVTDCCGSEEILQDAYVDPNTGEVASTFDNFICDSLTCSNYGQACGCTRTGEKS